MAIEAGSAHRTADGCSIAGIPIQDATCATLVEQLIALASSPGTDVAVGINAHVVNLAREYPPLHRELQRTINYADGQSVVWAARLLGGRLTERIATTDLAEPLLRAATQRELPVFFFGAAPGVAELAAERMKCLVAGLDIRTHHGFDDDARVLAAIAQHDPAILFVGLGNPRQEQWVARYRDQLPPVVLTCGGLFDWLSGSNPRAPRWLISLGLEWLWRLGLEPRRLGRRYLLGNPSFISTVLRQRRGDSSVVPSTRST